MAYDIDQLPSDASVPAGDFLVEMGPGVPPVMVSRDVLFNAIVQLLNSTYAPVAHSHAIANITGLQAAIDAIEARLAALE